MTKWVENLVGLRMVQTMSKNPVRTDSETLPSIYQNIIALSRYARYIPEKQRRETWEETVDRYINYMYKKVKDNPNVSEEDRKYIHGVLGATCDL